MGSPLFNPNLRISDNPMKRYSLRRLALLAVLAQASLPAYAGDIPTDAPWLYNAPGRPAVLINTDRYAYPRTPTDETNRSLHLSIVPTDYREPVTTFLYWENRDTGERLYYNQYSGMSEEPIDLRGSPGQLLQIWLREPVERVVFDQGEQGAPAFPAELKDDEPGHYLWCLELRNGDATRTVARAYALYNVVDEIVDIQGDISRDTRWTRDRAYRLNGRVNVVGHRTLTIEPGTVVMGATDELSLLNVESGSRLVADGKPLFPIIFTSDKPFGQRATSDWGGLIINGNAPVNEPNAEGEGGTGRYGGDNPLHDGGVLRYVRIEYSGRIFSLVDELNGLTLQGCGSGTVIDHVQIHHPSDDGIEFFGGTVNASHLLMTGCGDDSLDWTYGYRGKLQNLVMIQLYNEADRGIEADNHPTNPDAKPRSMPTIYNATFLGLAITNADQAKMANAILMRRGSGAKVYNTIFAGFGGMTAGIESESSADQYEQGGLSFQDCMFYQNFLLCKTLNQTFPNEELVAEMMTDPKNYNQFANPGFTCLNAIKPDLTPLPGSAAAMPAHVATPPGDGFFRAEDYLGGINPRDPDGPWVFGPWTNYAVR